MYLSPFRRPQTLCRHNHGESLFINWTRIVQVSYNVNENNIIVIYVSTQVVLHPCIPFYWNFWNCCVVTYRLCQGTDVSLLFIYLCVIELSMVKDLHRLDKTQPNISIWCMCRKKLKIEVAWRTEWSRHPTLLEAWPNYLAAICALSNSIWHSIWHFGLQVSLVYTVLNTEGYVWWKYETF